VIFRDLDAFQFYGPDSFERYVSVVARMQGRSRSQGRARARERQAKLEAHEHTPGLSPPSLILAEQRRDLLSRWISQLPDIYRRALEHWLAGGKDETLAKSEGIALSTARSRRRHARRLLQMMLEEGSLTPLTPGK
jgi:DNA-directed RNA polymerase specialized sigma24 family protein